jgi:hypothetical protein
LVDQRIGAQRGLEMDVVLAIVFAIALVVATVTVHYEVLRGISFLIPQASTRPRSLMLFVITGVLAAHLIEVSLYAVAYYLMHVHFSLGTIGGEFGGSGLDFFYFSITCYTTLGVGDLFPHGPLRLVAGIEALNGFVLIGWSASFTYLSMGRFWDQHPLSRP